MDNLKREVVRRAFAAFGTDGTIEAPGMCRPFELHRVNDLNVSIRVTGLNGEGPRYFLLSVKEQL